MNKKQNTNPSTMKIKQVKHLENMMTCILDHEVNSTTASYDWCGPKFTKEMWNEILSFFRWNHSATKSEAQVRIYVNHKTNTWKAWAFPQKANLGMSAKELDDPWGPEQFPFSESDGWLYYGTVHDHSSASAFQSGTDAENERKIDGLHITVGNLDAKHYSIHSRVYQSGFKVNGFRLSDFWDIGNAFEGLTDDILSLMPIDAKDRIAIHQMGTPPPSDVSFPEVWKSNIRFDAPVLVNNSPTPSFLGSSALWQREGFTERCKNNLDWDFKRCLSEMKDLIEASPDINMESVIETVNEFSGFCEYDMDIIDILLHNDVNPFFFIKMMEELQLESELNSKSKSVFNPTPEESQSNLMDYEGGNNIGGNGYGYGYGIE